MNVEQVTATCWSPSSRRAWIEIGCQHHTITPVSVALLAEGVDRNQLEDLLNGMNTESPSSRRAWIEIPMALP